MSTALGRISIHLLRKFRDMVGDRQISLSFKTNSDMWAVFQVFAWTAENAQWVSRVQHQRLRFERVFLEESRNEMYWIWDDEKQVYRRLVGFTRTRNFPNRKCELVAVLSMLSSPTYYLGQFRNLCLSSTTWCWTQTRRCSIYVTWKWSKQEHHLSQSANSKAHFFCLGSQKHVPVSSNPYMTARAEVMCSTPKHYLLFWKNCIVTDASLLHFPLNKYLWRTIAFIWWHSGMKGTWVQPDRAWWAHCTLQWGGPQHPESAGYSTVLQPFQLSEENGNVSFVHLLCGGWHIASWGHKTMQSSFCACGAHCVQSQDHVQTVRTTWRRKQNSIHM